MDEQGWKESLPPQADLTAVARNQAAQLILTSGHLLDLVERLERERDDAKTQLRQALEKLRRDDNDARAREAQLSQEIARPEPSAPVGLGVRVTHLRQVNGWDQKTLAREAGCSRATVSRIEAHRHSPSAAHLMAIAQALGVSAETLWYGPAGPGAEADR